MERLLRQARAANAQSAQPGPEPAPAPSPASESADEAVSVETVARREAQRALEQCVERLAAAGLTADSQPVLLQRALVAAEAHWQVAVEAELAALAQQL